MSKKLLLSLCLVGAVYAYGCSDDSASTAVVPGTSGEAVCGDGIVDADMLEQCDDGNTSSGDGCSAICVIESGYECPPFGGACHKVDEPDNPDQPDNPDNPDNPDEPDNPDQPDNPDNPDNPNLQPACGNGIVEAGEECDADIETFGCVNCQVADGWACTNEMGKASSCHRIWCGDGFVDGTEECDKGSANNNASYGDKDGCTADCKLAPYCGDAITSDGEACDSGTENNTAVYGDERGCTAECKRPEYCGDGIKNGSEACDVNDIKSAGGCTETCEVKEGYVCHTDGTCVELPPDYKPGCGVVNETTGETVIDLGEECDQKGNGCNNCKAADGYKCINGSPKPCTDCSAEAGKQCKKISDGYGNGILDPDGYEECDDGNKISGDGCSATGEVEPGYVCRVPGQKCTTVCGDGIRTADEECDDGNKKAGDGCSVGCTIENGATCTTLTVGKKSVCSAGKCGDGKVGKGEVCDDGNTVSGDGCASDCMAVEAYFQCKKTGGACDLTVCGDGKVNGGSSTYIGEECDLGSGKNKEGSGCSPFCRLELGYECSNNNCTSVRAITTSERCGNGKVESGEACDDGNRLGGDGCSPDCRVETSFECNNDSGKSVCAPKCGDGVWNYTSTKVPGKKATSVKDLIEECDDGNNINGDGCSRDCKLEDGWYLDLPTVTYPNEIKLPVTFRDFIGYDLSGTARGYATAAWVNRVKNKYGNTFTTWKDDCTHSATNGTVKTVTQGKGHPDFEQFSGNLCTKMMSNTLGRDGKPVLTHEALGSACGEVVNKNPNTHVKDHILCTASFDSWYRDDNPINEPIQGELMLEKVSGAADGTYQFDSANPPADAKTPDGLTYTQINKNVYHVNGNYTTSSYFAPLYGIGFYKISNERGNFGDYLTDKKANGSFTTEIHTTIQYNGEPASLTFHGDDDVWVYLNNKLFVDVGGMHSKWEKTGSIKSETCSNGQVCDKTFGLYKGGIYDLKVFHAERGRTASNFKLTLTGFVVPQTGTPKASCGDGFVVGTEECDYKCSEAEKKLGCTDAALNAFMGCKNCKLDSSNKDKTCGNGRLDKGETCDTGHLCKNSANKVYCDRFGIEYTPNAKCDEATCQLSGANCGNNKLDGEEECDGTAGLKNGEYCTQNCTKSVCGDGLVDTRTGEECDLGKNNKDDGSTGCTTQCKKPTCGDGIVSSWANEVCDDGVNDGAYGRCNPGCMSWGPRCGDGKVQDVEQCDNGTAANNGQYGGCNSDCTRAAYCGDGIMNGDEQCDGDDPGTFECNEFCRRTVN